MSTTSLLNAFLAQARSRGSLTAMHIRPRGASPDNEVFCRKLAAVLVKMVPGFRYSASAKISEPASPGLPRIHSRLEQARGLYALADSTPGLRRYTRRGEPGADGGPIPAEYQAPDKRFALLHGIGAYELGRVLVASPGAGSSVAGAVLQLQLRGVQGAQEGALPTKSSAAADSVFQRSFADAYATMLCAAVDGNQEALAVLAEGRRLREAGGDFDRFSASALSHDTEAALSQLKARLEAGENFSALSRDELAVQALQEAVTSTSAWLNKHGVDSRLSDAFKRNLSAMISALASAGQSIRAGAGRRASENSAPRTAEASSDENSSPFASPTPKPA